MNNTIHIKEKNKSLFAKGIFYLSLMIISLTLTFLPVFFRKLSENSILFYCIGGSLFLIFTALYVLLLVKEFKPNDILILSSDGFYDLKNIGENLKVEWTNVASVKILGKKETPYLGINFENSDILIANMSKKNASEMRENINEGLPHVLISQSEIRYSVKELKEEIIKFVRDSRAVINEAPKVTKNNPFSTEDVLRAFGKLPIEEVQIPAKDEIIEPISNTSDDLSLNSNAAPIEKVTNEVDDSTPLNEAASDSFYSMLQVQLTEQNPSTQIKELDDSSQEGETTEQNNHNIETDSNSTESNSENDLSEEMKAILSLARSSKINEIEKMLSDNDTPFTFTVKPDTARASDDNSNVSGKSVEDIDNYFGTSTVEVKSENNDNVDNDEVLNQEIIVNSEKVENTDINDTEIDDYKIELPEELYQDEDSNIDMTLAALFSKNDSSEPAKEHDSKTDTIEFFPDLILIKDDETPSSSENDDDGFIIPDLNEYK